MSTRDERVVVFNDTQDWIQHDPELAASVQAAKQHTTVFYENDYPAITSAAPRETRIAVTPDRSFAAAMRLHKENPNAKIAVMNFANAFHPGGGVAWGASAQEECLCRTSTLYPLLDRKMLLGTYYKHHRDLGSPIATDSLVYTEGVVICKTDEDLPRRMPATDWVTVDVITIAAPDLREKSLAAMLGQSLSAKPGQALADAFITDEELSAIHLRRIKHMLSCAAAKGATILVLGAFGCGAFENPPAVVAKAFKQALEEFPKVFEKVEFAVYCVPGRSENYDVFKRVMG